MPRPNGSAFRSTSSASPRNGGSDAYASAMRAAVEHFRAQGVTHFIFGDIHLHDVRRYREAQLTPYGLEVVEPLWDETSEQIIEGLPRLGAAHRGVSRRWPTGSVPKPSAASSTRHSWPRCPQAPTPTAKTANTTPSATTAPSSARPYLSGSDRRSVAATTSATTTRHRAHLHLLVRRTRSGRITLRSAAVASSRRGDGMFPCTLPGFTECPRMPCSGRPHKYEPRRSEDKGSARFSYGMSGINVRTGHPTAYAQRRRNRISLQLRPQHKSWSRHPMRPVQTQAPARRGRCRALRRSRSPSSEKQNTEYSLYIDREKFGNCPYCTDGGFAT